MDNDRDRPEAAAVALRVRRALPQVTDPVAERRSRGPESRRDRKLAHPTPSARRPIPLSHRLVRLHGATCQVRSRSHSTVRARIPFAGVRRERFTFAGKRNDVPQLLTGVMDAFILPSAWEGLPVALLEAQARRACEAWHRIAVPRKPWSCEA